MSYEIEFDPEAKKFLEKLDQELSARIVSKIEDLKYKPQHFAKKLTGIKLWRLRVGDYRVLFDLYEQEGEIYIVKIGHRKNIYRDL